MVLSRFKIIIFVMFLFATAIVSRLFVTSVLQQNEWEKKADSTLLRRTDIKPDRGSLLAADGSLLAVNVTYYDVRMDFRADAFRADSLRKYLQPVCDTMAVVVKGTTSSQWKDRIEAELEKPADKRSRVFVIGNLTRSEIQRLRNCYYFKKKFGFNTLSRTPFKERRKPYGAMAYRSIGNVVMREDGLHGTSGLELAFDSLLFGTPGIGKSIQLTNGMRDWEEVAPQRGCDIQTTIDVRIQDILETELYNVCKETLPEWATAVIMEVSTGDIKAISNLTWSERQQDYIESVNNALRLYELGSVMKPISLMIALEDGYVTPETRVEMSGLSWSYARGGVISDTHSIGASPTVVDILAGSSNVGTAKIITGAFGDEPWKFRERLQDIGFFDQLNVGLAGEPTPTIQPLGSPDVKFENLWRVNLSRACYGYAVGIPPIHNLAIINAIANNGKFVRPRLVRAIWRPDSTYEEFPVSYVREQICRPEVAKQVQFMLKQVIWSEKKGVPTAPRLQNNFVTLAGKTGTARVFIPNKGYSTKLRLTFSGFFPYENPMYSCIVVFNDSKTTRGPQYCSGKVAMNVALKLFARGMLGNRSDFRTEADNTQTPPTLMAMPSDEAAAVKTNYSLDRCRQRVEQPAADGQVPSVIGMGLRDAVARLEKSGLNVAKIKGAGYVSGQVPAAGSPLVKGQKVTLYLNNNLKTEK